MNEVFNVVATLAAITKKLSRVDAFARSVAKQQGPAGKDGRDGEQGPAGKDGRDGVDGLNGRDGAAGKDGRDGIDGAAGKDGAAGRNGIDGKDGTRGPKGDTGETGPKGDQGPIPDHQWKGTKLRWQKPDGAWGKFVDLKGEKGKDGTNGGVVVVNRGSSSNGEGLGGLIPGNPNTEPSGIAVLQGGQWVNLPWQALITVISGALDMDTALARQTDFVGDSVIYRGEAMPGSAFGDPVWRIKKTEFLVDQDGKKDISEKWAGGNAAFGYAWTDRATLDYS